MYPYKLQSFQLKFLLSAYLILIPLWGYASTTSSALPSLELRQFIEQVWKTNPGIQSAIAQVEEAKANATASGRPLYNPELEFDGERVHNETIEDTYTVGISQTVDLFNKRKARYEVGRLSFAQAKALLDEKRLFVAISALTALQKFNTLKNTFKLASERTQLLEKFVGLTEQKHTAGDLGLPILYQSRLALSETILDQANIAVELSHFKEALTATIARILSDRPILPATLPSPSQVSSDPATLLANLPSLQRLNFQTRLANAQVKVAKTNTWPDPTLNLRGGEDDQKRLIGISLSIPLFVRNNFRAEVNAAHHKAIAADNAQLNAYWKAKARLEGAAARYTLIYQAYQQWQHVATGSLIEGVKLLDQLWNAGEISTTDYLIQLKQRIDSQIAGVKLQGEAWQAWFQWLEASGRLNQWLELNPQSNKRVF